MTARHTVCALVQIETNDPRLAPSAISVDTAAKTRRLRAAVMQHMPRDVTRLIAVMPAEHAQMLMMLHELVGDDIAAGMRSHGVDAEGVAARPPSDYVAPAHQDLLRCEACGAHIPAPRGRAT